MPPSHSLLSQSRSAETITRSGHDELAPTSIHCSLTTVHPRTGGQNYPLSRSIMAFNFNWSPLTADASFYTRAKELLTIALNKSPKPPIIVDDILVNELNLGSTPPELEILEIGDLAEDRFRGIFKMCYTGDAYLTLKTRVQVRHYGTLNFDA